MLPVGVDERWMLRIEQPRVSLAHQFPLTCLTTTPIGLGLALLRFPLFLIADKSLAI